METIIATYGINKPESVFSSVKSYDDLIKANVAFLQGKVRRTPYHCGPIDNETIPLVEDLVKINNYGFISTNGQPSQIIGPFIRNFETPMNYNPPNVCIGEREILYLQKPHIIGYLPKKYVHSFIDFMRNHEDFYYRIIGEPMVTIASTYPINSTEKHYYISSCKTNKINESIYEYYGITHTTSTAKLVEYGHRDFRFDFPDVPHCNNIKKILKQTRFVDISGRDFGVGSTEKLLLEFFQQYLHL